MRKGKILIISLIIIIFAVVGFSTYKIVETINDINLVKASAIRKAEIEYPGNEFYVTGVTPNIAKHGLDYAVRLGVVNNDVTRINCYVTTRTIVDGYYPTNIWGGTNIEYLETE